MEPTKRVVGKRQVRPNLTRADFGYEERTRTIKKSAAQKGSSKREDEDANGSAAAGTGDGQPVRAEKDAKNLTVDFTRLDMTTLKRYKRHYRLKTRQNVTKPELAQAVAKHFATQTVDEADTISLFMYSARAGTIQYDRRDYLIQGNR